MNNDGIFNRWNVSDFVMILILGFIAFFIWLALSYKSKKNNGFATPYPIEFDGLDLDVVTEINKHRLIIGLNELKGASNLTEMAKNHVNWMIENEVSHYGYADRENKAHAYSFGEVICTYRTSAYSYLMSYLHSVKGHKEVLEKNNITHIGIYTDKNTGLQCILVAGY